MKLLKAFCLVLILHAPALGVISQPAMLEENDAAELVGASVQSAEGVEVGEVSAVTMNKDGEVTEIRMTMERSLGIGAKTVVLPQNSYLVMRGTVILRLPLGTIRQLPPVDDRRRR
jgi:hypothetical protein